LPLLFQITRSIMRILLATSLSFLVLIAMPVALRAARYWETANSEWWSADRSTPASGPHALGLRGPRLRGAHCALERHFAVHTWIVLKQDAGPL
jgi:hypothetical protein